MCILWSLVSGVLSHGVRRSDVAVVTKPGAHVAVGNKPPASSLVQSSAVANKPGAILVPGDGLEAHHNFDAALWYGHIKQLLAQKNGVQCAGKVMPDPFNVDKWLPFIANDLAGGPQNLENIVVIGHSAGARAAMLLAEQHKIKGLILIAQPTKLDRDYDYGTIVQNCGFIVQFASEDDYCVSIQKQRYVKQKIEKLAKVGQFEYIEMKEKGHFACGPRDLPTEIEDMILAKCK